MWEALSFFGRQYSELLTDVNEKLYVRTGIGIQDYIKSYAMLQPLESLTPYNIFSSETQTRANLIKQQKMKRIILQASRFIHCLKLFWRKGFLHSIQRSCSTSRPLQQPLLRRSANTETVLDLNSAKS